MTAHVHEWRPSPLPVPKGYLAVEQCTGCPSMRYVRDQKNPTTPAARREPVPTRADWLTRWEKRQEET